MKAPRLPLPRYTRRKLLAGGTWAYFFEVPTKFRKAGCTLENEALGTDYEVAIRRVETVLLPQLDSWRSGGRSDLAPARDAPGTFDWLAACYKNDKRYKRLSRHQRALHDRGLRLVADHSMKSGRRFGSLRLQAITPAVADRIHDLLLTVREEVEDADGRPVVRVRERRATVNHAMKSCQRAWNVIRRAEPDLVPAANPFAKMGLEDKSRETPTATLDDLGRFVAACDAAGVGSIGTAAMIAWEWLQREEHIFGAFLVEHYRPRERPREVYIVHPKTDEAIWIPLFDETGVALFPELMARLDAIKRERIGGLMIVRDWKDEAAGVPVPWVTRSGDLTYMRHRSKAVIRSAGLRGDLSFGSFRHGGMTELGDADLTDSQIRAISRHKNTRTLPRYVKRTQRQIIAGTRKRRQIRAEKDEL